MKVVEQFKRRILDLAIRGKLVPQDPNDEPASVLLERIKAEKAKLVKAGKIKKEKNPSEIVIGSDGAAYEKLGVGCCNAEAQRRRVDVSFDLPQGWAWVRLRDLGTFTGGHTPSTSNRDLWGDEVLWVTSKDMKSKYINDTILKLTQLGAAELTMLKPNSIIMCTRSGILRRTFPVAIATQHLTINQDQRALTLYIPEMAEYIYDVLKAFESVILAHYKKAGTTVESIIWNRFTEIPIPMPPLPEQRRIIAKIEELFAIADSLGVAVDGLENAAKRLDKKVLDLAIRGKLVPQDPDDEPASELVKRIAASHKSPCKNQSEPIDPPFESPDSWEWVRLKELGVFCGGHTPSTSNPKLWGGDILWVSSKDMKSKYIDDTQIKVTRLGAEELNVLKPGALLMCTRSGILRRVFPVAIARRELTINQDQRALTLWLPEMIEYVYLALKSLESIILSDYKKSGTTVESIIWNKFVDLPIPLPPLNEQKRIVKRVEALKATTRTLVTF